MIAPAAKRSGHVAIITAVIAAPAESPTMYTRSLSIPCAAISASIIDMIDWFSPCPRTRFAASPYSPAQLKQRTGLLPVVCSA